LAECLESESAGKACTGTDRRDSRVFDGRNEGKWYENKHRRKGLNAKEFSKDGCLENARKAQQWLPQMVWYTT